MGILRGGLHWRNRVQSDNLVLRCAGAAPPAAANVAGGFQVQHHLRHGLCRAISRPAIGRNRIIKAEGSGTLALFSVIVRSVPTRSPELFALKILNWTVSP